MSVVRILEIIGLAAQEGHGTAHIDVHDEVRGERVLAEFAEDRAREDFVGLVRHAARVQSGSLATALRTMSTEHGA